MEVFILSTRWSPREANLGQRAVIISRSLIWPGSCDIFFLGEHEETLKELVEVEAEKQVKSGWMCTSVIGSVLSLCPTARRLHMHAQCRCTQITASASPLLHPPFIHFFYRAEMHTMAQNDRVYEMEGRAAWGGWPRMEWLIDLSRCTVCIMRTVLDRSVTHDSIAHPRDGVKMIPAQYQGWPRGDQEGRESGGGCPSSASTELGPCPPVSRCFLQ